MIIDICFTFNAKQDTNFISLLPLIRLSHNCAHNMIRMKADGAQHTHWGACGPCSTSQDLAVYMRNPDLTLKGQECGVRGLFDPNDGINCFMEAGYTRECSEIWMYK